MLMDSHKPTPKWIDFLGIVLMSVLCAVMYGLIQDQVSIRISPAYFLLFHPRIVDSDDVTVVALAWGVAATWWVGLALGYLVAVFATWGPKSVYCPRRALHGLIRVMGGTGVATLICGAGAYLVNWVSPIAQQYVDGAESIRRFSAVLAAHNASYLAAPILAALLAARIWKSRGAFGCA